MLLGKINKSILLSFIVLIVTTGCGKDRARDIKLKQLNNDEHVFSPLVLGVTKDDTNDTDNDGLSNSYEQNVTGTNPFLADSDRDGLKDREEIEIYHTDPFNPDSDGDCLLDGYEVKYYETDPKKTDTDGDKIPDGVEIYSFMLGEADLTCLYSPETLERKPIENPPIDNLQSPDVINALDPRISFKDSDGDGLSDKEETEKYHTDPLQVDSDNDGLSDGDEVLLYGTDPFEKDSDNDGIDDGIEVHTYGTNPAKSDSDGDGLLDSFEIFNYETNATNKDTDGDGIDDGIEIYSYNLLDLNESSLSNPETLEGGFNSNPPKDGFPNPNDDIINALDSRVDSDGDGVSNEDERKNGTNPFKADSDGDGVSDGDEIKNGTNPLKGDSDGDGLSDGDEAKNGTDPLKKDTDGDGLSDGDEIKNGTDPLKKDTDGDGLSDGEEVNTYDTNATNPDTDNDGLKDAEEIKTYKTNAKNPDTDGDCLLDSFEVLQYKTDPKLKDTDGDKVNDGIEIYLKNKDKGEVYDEEDFNVDCLSNPETLKSGYNSNPAKDAIPDATNDVIDALDPTNDSDGDGQSNIQESKCPEGDASDSKKTCPYLIDNTQATTMSELGYAYIPGGFDVDGDDKVEGGFWMSRYQARKTDGIIEREDVIRDVGDINKYVSSHFNVLNKNIEVTNYSEGFLNETTTFAGNKLTFDESIARTEKRITGITPYLAQVSLVRTKIIDNQTGEELDLNITLPTMKQYLQVKMLLDADKKDGDGRHIRNGLLGIDPNIPLFEYTLVIDEFADNMKEYVRNLVQIRDTSIQDGDRIFSSTDIPDWWDVSRFEMLNRGSNATQDLGFGIGSEKDAYGVIVRARGVLDITQGMSGALTDDEGTTNGISFRAATPYLW